MMGFSSITKRLLFLVIAFFLISMIIIFIASEFQLKKIIDSGQRTIYQEKIELIMNELLRAEIRLQKTGLVEAYSDDFQNTVLKDLTETYYGSNSLIYPFILKDNLSVLMHPTLKRGVSAVNAGLFIPVDSTALTGEFLVKSPETENWIIYSTFAPWNWVVCYSVPLDLKYADLFAFRTNQLEIMISCTILILTFLSLSLINLNKPIVKLTEISRKIADGQLDQFIDITGKDEVSILALSFSNMQASIKKKIEDLNLEIAERQRTEKELSTARNYISSIINSMPSVLIGVNEDGVITQWNNRAEIVTGISEQDALGRNVEGIHPSLSIDAQSIARAVRNGFVVYESGRKSLVNEHFHYDDITIYPLVIEDSTGAVIRIDDVTEKTQMKEQLSQSQKMDAIGQLAGGVAHDFNNMLMGISSAAQLLKSIEEDRIDASEDVLKYISIIQDASKRSADLTAKLLTFGRKTTLSMAPVDVHKVINETLALLERTLDKRISISVRPDAEHFVFSGEFSSIQNALINLAINASQAMPDGGDLIIRTKNTFLDDYYCSYSPFSITPGLYIDLTVEDTGSGIPMDIIGKVFDPFFTTKEQGRGTGLGLSSVYGIIQGHNGAITVYSEEGSGTVFHLYLPCAGHDAAAVTDQSVMTRGSGVILLVDDEEIIRRTSRPLLEAMGYTVLLAGDGQEALDIFVQEAGRIKAVITDMIMPRMNGRELIIRLREIDKDCPVIITSGFTRDEDMNLLKKKGISGFLQKPFSRESLAGILSGIL